MAALCPRSTLTYLSDKPRGSLRDALPASRYHNKSEVPYVRRDYAHLEFTLPQRDTTACHGRIRALRETSQHGIFRTLTRIEWTVDGICQEYKIERSFK